MDLTFDTLSNPIQMKLSPKPDAASNENAVAKFASLIENCSKIDGGKFIFSLDVSIQNTKTTGAFTYGWLFAASTSASLVFWFLT